MNSYAFDIGSMYNTGWQNLKIGMVLRNFGPDIRYRVDNDEDGLYDEDPFDLFDNDGDGLVDEDGPELDCKIPMSFSLGISGDIMRTDTSHWIASLQLDNVVDRKKPGTWEPNTSYQTSSSEVDTRSDMTPTVSVQAWDIASQHPSLFSILTMPTRIWAS